MIDLVNAPKYPGCYIFSDEKGKIIYIGKAKHLNKRVKQYFQNKALGQKTKTLVKEIRSVEFIITDNETEALILENNLIKKHHPKFNINLKDSKNYAYIRLTDESFPRLEIARSKKGKGEHFGPFVSAVSRDHILSTLKKTFKFRTCKKMPKKACLRYHINHCQAPCLKNLNENEYKSEISGARWILKGKTRHLLKSLEKRMKIASHQMNYELAMKLKNQMEAIEGLNRRQKMDRDKTYNEDIINFLVKNDVVYLILFNVYKGVLENKQIFKFETSSDDFLEEFLIQYYSDNRLPQELILPVMLKDPMIKFLDIMAGRSVRLLTPQRGEKKQLLDLVLKNIEITFFGDREKLEDLKRKLKMQDTPRIIECFDISHISGTSTVASMVQFRDALPDKNNYRRFRIRTVKGIDDYSAVSEVVRRRYIRLLRENKEMPDLILIDGGFGQLNTAIIELKKLNIHVPIISIAKRFEEIYVPGTGIPLVLNKKSKALKFLQQIRDEAHRFAIKYNRLLRKKEMLS